MYCSAWADPNGSPSGEEQGPVKDAGDKCPSRRGGHGAPTSPGEHREGLGFEACRRQSPTPAQTPARACRWLRENGRVGARPCSVPAPGAWLTALATACPCPALASSLSACLPVWGLSACTSRPGLGFSEGHGAPAACHLRPLPLGWTHCLPIKPPPREPGPPSPAWSRQQVEGQGRWVQPHQQFRV